MAVSDLNLYQRLAAIRKYVEVVQTDKSGFGYRYVTDEALFARITGAMAKYHVSLIPSVVPGTMKIEPYHYEKLKKGKNKGDPDYLEPQNEILVTAEMTYSWVNDDDPTEFIGVPWVLVGQQADASQAFGSALTYSMRYFILKYFDVATPDDDPDKWRSKQREAEEAEDKAITAGILSEFDTSLKSWLADNGERRDDVLAFIKGFEKTGDYRKITDSKLAAKLMTDFKTKFIQKTEE